MTYTTLPKGLTRAGKKFAVTFYRDNIKYHLGYHDSVKKAVLKYKWAESQPTEKLVPPKQRPKPITEAPKLKLAPPPLPHSHTSVRLT